MRRRHLLQREQTVPKPVDQVFEFFADAANLQTLTPDTLHFQIMTPMPMEMHAGAVIDYRLKLFGFPFTWKTLIETFEPPVRFIDVQAKGPYRFWRHTHTFTAVPGGTRVVDNVEYELPLGALGSFAHALFVRRTLKKIFDYRAAQMEGVFHPPTRLNAE